MLGVSWVATVLLSVDLSEDPALVEGFSHWLRLEAPRRKPAGTLGVGYLEQLDALEQGWAGWKYPEVRLWGGALNDADLPAVVNRFAATPWRHPDSVQLLITDQEQAAFRLWMIRDGRAVC